ncbi:DUF4286 family protein [Burkholderia sp. Ac-20392]|uniref:DUF4286 family protein n=1 Tax=Burkholderia sp. Ac-20392 TaxID=2703905 RepID=UPI001F11DBEA|nr:DUF4286 family protein [Burkholderia sp. Ac-20392]MBN3800565.1 hypothetical protein [Burkholderia sp. Ac-20392]
MTRLSLPHGQLCVWTDIDPAHEADFNAWYDREHMQERVAIPGFTHARRFRATDRGPRKYLALYVTDALDVFHGDAYRRAFTQQTAWSLANFERMTGTQRRVGELTIEAGDGEGAHLALFDQAAWDKYGLAKFAGAAFPSNTLLDAKPAQSKGAQDHELPDGAFSSHDNSLAALQQRGVVFLSCHNAIWELAERLDGANANPDKLPLDALAADLTNHVIPSAIVTPGAVGTLPELQQAGFTYAK